MLKSLELLPTNENVLATLYKDTFNRNKDVVSFLNLLTEIEGHYAISIDGKWGSGKTFFVKQCSMILDVLRDKSMLTSEEKEKVLHIEVLSDKIRKKLEGQYCIYFDAWSNDGYENPIVAVLNALINNLSVFKKVKQKINLQQVLSASKEIGEELVKKFSGIDISSLENIIKNDDIEKIKEQDKIHHSIDRLVNSLIGEGERLNIFVDELDRCKPSFAVKLLEQIKHYFLIENVTFIFSTNILELSKTINKFYGSDFHGDRYLNRFFDLSLSIPKINPQAYFEYMISQDSNWIYVKNELAIIDYLHMSLRSINRFIADSELIDFKKIRKNQSIFVPSENAIYTNILWLVIPAIIGLRVAEPIIADSFLSGKEEKLFFNILSVSQFWNVILHGGFEKKLLSLCDIEDSDELEINKEKIANFIYNKLFRSSMSAEEVHSQNDNFWYIFDQNLNNFTEVVLNNLSFNQ